MNSENQKISRPWQGFAGIFFGSYMLISSIINIYESNIFDKKNKEIEKRVFIERMEKETGEKLKESEKKSIEKKFEYIPKSAVSYLDDTLFITAMFWMFSTLSFWLRWRIGIIFFLISSSFSIIQIFKGNISAGMMGNFGVYIAFYCLNHPFYQKKKIEEQT